MVNVRIRGRQPALKDVFQPELLDFIEAIMLPVRPTQQLRLHNDRCCSPAVGCSSQSTGLVFFVYTRGRDEERKKVTLGRGCRRAGLLIASNTAISLRKGSWENEI